MIEPKVRFKADDGSQFPDWEEKELGQILTEDLYPVKNPDGAYTKLAIRSHGKGTFDRHVEAGESLDVDKMFEVKANRLILNITFAWELAIAITTNEDEGKLVSHRFPQYKISGNIDFYKYRLINERMRYDLGVASPGGAGRNRVLNRSAFLKIKKYIPSLPEQQKIAEFLSTVDTVIEKQKETVSAWEERKKGVMQKLFSQEVRFKADDGSEFPEWEEKTFHEVIKLYRGSSPRPIVEYIVDDNQGLNWIKISDVPQNGNVITTVKEHISKEGAEKSRAVYKGEIILSNSMSFGKPCILGIDGFIHDGWFVIREYEKYLNKWYLCQLLNSDIMYKQYRRLAAGGVVLNISSEIVNSTKIPVPCLAEQQKIADCLSSLDEVIEKQKATLAAWEELKKGLLQQMFV